MKKALILLISLFTIIGLAACGGGSDGLSVDDVVKAFEDASLEVEDVTKMGKDDYGMAPMKNDEAVRFLIPSLGEDSGGRIFSFSNQSDLNKTKEYYDVLGEESALFFSWTIEHENILVQINGDLPEEKYEKYKAALENIK